MRLAPAPSLTTNDRHTVTHENTLSCRDCQRNCQNCQGPRTEHRVIRLKYSMHQWSMGALLETVRNTILMPMRGIYISCHRSGIAPYKAIGRKSNHCPTHISIHNVNDEKSLLLTP